MNFKVCSDTGWSLAGRAARESEQIPLGLVCACESQCCFLRRGSLTRESAGDSAAHLPLSEGYCWEDPSSGAKLSMGSEQSVGLLRAASVLCGGGRCRSGTILGSLHCWLGEIVSEATWFVKAAMPLPGRAFQ